MKNLKFILILFICLLFNSCKKETPPPINNTATTNSQSAGDVILVSTKWKQKHEYRNTTRYAKSNLGLWPLLSTIEVPMDSCELSSKIWFHSNQNLYTIKGQQCPTSTPDSNLVSTWDLILNDTKIVFGGSDTMNVYIITNNQIKLWNKSYALDSVGGIWYTQYNMLKFESAP